MLSAHCSRDVNFKLFRHAQEGLCNLRADCPERKTKHWYSPERKDLDETRKEERKERWKHIAGKCTAVTRPTWKAGDPVDNTSHLTWELRIMFYKLLFLRALMINSIFVSHTNAKMCKWGKIRQVFPAFNPVKTLLFACLITWWRPGGKLSGFSR